MIKGKAKGAQSKLSTDQFTLLRELLLQGALHHGFETDNWTRERIAQLIMDKFQVSYHAAHISRLMKKMGFSSQKPRTRSYRKDELQVQHWKTEQLPRIKKSDE